ncbi:MAG TPA: FtsW/RodA/SpoVE family cell cycle protein [Kofleriaceae bacterium]
MMSRSRLVEVLEIGALAICGALAWSLSNAASAAWLARVDRLGLRGPDPASVRALANHAVLYFTAGIVVLAAARIAATRGRRRLAAAESLAVPWILPAAAAATLFGLVLHLATVESSRGVAEAPGAASFAQGFFLGCLTAAAILLAPLDLAELVSRRRGAIAVAIAVIFGALAVAGSGPAGSGTRINLGPVQPIEAIKLLAIAFLAAYLGARAPKLRWHRRRVLGLRWPRLELLVPALLVLLGIVAGLRVIGDLGPVLILALVFLGMFFVASRATGWVVAAVALLAIVLIVLWAWPGLAGSGTVKTRLVMWHAPWANGLPNGHQLGEGLWAMSAGGWDGQGLGRAATPLVPAGKTDLAFATLTEQIGARGLLLYQLALAALVLGALHVAARSRTAERVLIASGVATLVLAQWLVILGGTLGYLPLTGIVVPFVSGGKSSMVVFVAAIALTVRLSTDARARAASTELDELHAAARGLRIAAAIAMALAVCAGMAAAMLDRVETSARGIVTRLRDGTLVHRQNPRLVALIERTRRGQILDRTGTPLATSASASSRSYALGAAMGTLLGVWPTRVLLPSWALERQLDGRLRGYPERTGGPRYRDFDSSAGAMPWPDLRAFVGLLDLDDAGRDAAIAARDADLASRSVRLTIDSKLQTRIAALAAGAVAKHHRLAAAAVVIDVDTGDVLARVQVPDYDPNNPRWQEHLLAGDRAFLLQFRGAYGEWPDKTGIQGMFQSGSVGKLFTSLAAIRTGAADSRFTCRDADAQGPLFTLPGWPRPIHDHSGERPHGTIDLAQALAVSCNVYFAQLGLAMGAEPFTELRRDGLEIGYADALAPGAPGTRQLASTAFGQGAMVMSAMQAARMVAAIAAGGRYRTCSPTMELGASCADTALVSDPAALRPMLEGMRRVMTGGTGTGLTSPTGVRVYGKTGTADVRGFAGEEPSGIARGAAAAPHSWFVAFAEPATTTELASVARKRLAIAVVIPRGGTGASAAGPLGMQILTDARDLGYLR